MTTMPPWPHDPVDAAAAIRLALDDRGAAPEPIGEGDFCFAFRVGSDVVRVAKHAEAAAALERESRILPEIADALPMPVPRLRFHRLADGRACTVHPELRGTALARSAWEALGPDVREGAARDLARFLDALHAQPVTTALALGAPTAYASEWAARFVDRTARIRAHLGAATYTRLDAFLRRCAAGAWADRTPVLLHRDIGLDHLLWNPARETLAGVIDFGDFAVGDRAREYIHLYEDVGPWMLKAVLRHTPRLDHDAFVQRVHAWRLLEGTWWVLARLGEGATEEAEACLADFGDALELLSAKR